MTEDEIEALKREIFQLREQRGALRLDGLTAGACGTPGSSLDQALEAGGIGLFVVDIAAQQIFPTAGCCGLFGLPPQRVYPTSIFERLVLPEDRDLASSHSQRVDGSIVLQTEYRIARANDDSIRTIRRQATLEHAADGTPVRLAGAVQDVTAQRRLEALALRREADLQALSSSRQFVIDLTARQRMLTDPDTVMRLTSEALAERLGANRVGFYRLLGQERVQHINGWTDGHLPLQYGIAAATEAGSAMAQHRASGSPLVYTDSRHDVDGKLQPMADAGVLSGIVVPLLSNQRWHAGMQIDHASVRAWSAAEVALVREVAELAWLAVERAEALTRLQHRLSMQSDQIASNLREIQGQKTGRESAEQQVRQLQKMEAVGLLTGGIAHDFNNMLAVIIGSLNMIERRRKRGETDIDRFVEAAMGGAKSAATLTSRLLSFARQQPLAPKALDVNRLIEGMTDLLNRTLGDAIQLEVIGTAGVWTTHADENQLENVLINLAVNARDAMPDGGKLTIETANVHVERDYATEYEIPVGHYVKASVTDTGTGMPPEVMAKAFDPFFSTKAAGKGSGLGLSQVYGFARQSGGHVRIYSELGHGTTVRLYLPRHWGPTDATERPAPRPAVRRGDASQIVLVVEDEERMRAITVEALRELGYTVLHASNGPEALSIINAGRDVTLLFTDIVMPEMSGRQLADLALIKLPRMKVVYTTGYTRNAVVHNGVIDPGTHFLAKPFSIDALAEQIARVMDEDVER